MRRGAGLPVQTEVNQNVGHDGIQLSHLIGDVDNQFYYLFSTCKNPLRYIFLV